MYDPTIGRFLSEDPIGFAGDSSNVYRYVGNAAAMYTDPSGLDSRINRGGNLIWQGIVGRFWFWISTGEMGVAYELRDESDDFAEKFAPTYSEGWKWKQNGARHAIWMSELTLYFGNDIAEKIGDTHEFAWGEKPWDTWIDQYNNAAARRFAGERKKRGDLKNDLLNELNKGKQGRFITDSTDLRIPADLRKQCQQWEQQDRARRIRERELEDERASLTGRG